MIQTDESYQLGGGRNPRDVSARSKDEEREIAAISSFNKKLSFRGWTFNPTIHASAQAHDRRSDYTLNHWKQLHLRVWEKVDELATKNGKSGDYLFYSKSLEQGYVAAVDFRKKEIRIVTVLPKGRNKAKDGTTFKMMEGLEEFIILEEFELE